MVDRWFVEKYISGEICIEEFMEANFIDSTSEKFGDQWMLDLADELGYDNVRFEGSDRSVGIRGSELLLFDLEAVSRPDLEVVKHKFEEIAGFAPDEVKFGDELDITDNPNDILIRF